MILKDYKIHFRPTAYDRLTLQNMTVEDVKNNLDRFGIKQKDLVKMLDIDKSSIARLLSVDSCLTKYQKAFFTTFLNAWKHPKNEYIRSFGKQKKGFNYFEPFFLL